MAGYQNRILRVDLTKRTFSEESLSKELIHSFVGGRGFGVKLLYDELKPGTDPLGEESQLIFVSGPLAGTNDLPPVIVPLLKLELSPVDLPPSTSK